MEQKLKSGVSSQSWTMFYGTADKRSERAAYPAGQSQDWRDPSRAT